MARFQIGKAKKERKSGTEADELDLKIIEELQKDSSKTMQEIGAALKVPFTTIHLRKKKLELDKTITGYKAIVDKTKIGLKTKAIIFIKVPSRKNLNIVTDRLKKLSSVEGIMVLSGEHQVMAIIRVKDAKEFQDLLYSPKDGLQTWDGVGEFTSYMVLEDIK